MAVFVAADAILGVTTIRQITQGDHKANQEHRKAMISGGNTISQISGKAAAEVTSLTSGDLAALVALNASAFINSGLCLSATTITVPYKARDTCGSFQSGSTHDAVTGSAAFVVPTLFEASQDADFATGQFDVHWVSGDGLTKGADDATGQALAAQSFNAEFALGPCYINGTLLVGVQSFRVTPGMEITKVTAGGQIWPTQIHLKSVVPTIEITVNDFATIAGTVGDWTAMTSANCYLRRRADSGVYSAGADNIRFTFAAGLADTSSVAVSQNENGTATIMLHGKTLTASAAVAIP